MYERVWAGKWCGESLSDQFSFLSEKIEQEWRALTTKCDLRLVTWPLLAIAVHVQVRVLTAARGHTTNLRSHFVIRVHCSWLIFSPRKENWPKRLSPHHSPAQTLTNISCEIRFSMEFCFNPWTICCEHLSCLSEYDQKKKKKRKEKKNASRQDATALANPTASQHLSVFFFFVGRVKI